MRNGVVQPRQPGADHHRADEDAKSDERERGTVLTLQDSGDLEADEDEQDGVEEEDEDIPEREAAQAGAGARKLGDAPADDQADDDGADDAREPDLLRGQVPRVGTGW